MTDNTENKDKTSQETTYRDSIALLNQIGIERSLLNYFFIFINVILIAINSWILFSSFSFIGMSNVRGIEPFILILYPCMILLFIEFLINYYWYRGSKELFLLHEMRYKILYDFEYTYNIKGLIGEEWNTLGNNRSRRSPVFLSLFINQFPLMFMLMHCLQFIVVLLIYIKY